MSELPPARPVYFDSDGRGVFGFLHLPADDARRDLGVLICPPFGWDDICSYRSRREWATQLAHAGHPALRIDLPGSGDSEGSPRDPERVAAWIGSTGAAAAWLRERTGVQRIAAIGIGLGGVVATAALAQGAPIDDLVLWCTPARGRALVRELRVFGRLEADGLSPNRARGGSLRLTEQTPAPPDEDTLEVGGFLMTAETVGALEGLDLTALTIPNPAAHHVLLLERDGLPADARLSRHLQTAGVSTSVAPGLGYGKMMAEPQDAVPPQEVFSTVESWLSKRSAPADDRAVESEGIAISQAEATLELSVDGIPIRETPFVVKQPFGELFGILSEPLEKPAEPLGAVMFNAGAVHRIGPNRMWVETARRWAARGVPVLRVDLEALGDADGDSLASRDPAARYAPKTIEQVQATLDALQERGVASRFVLCGLCSGAYWSFQGALRDERVSSIFLLNGAVFFWNPAISKLRDLRAGLHNVSLWRRILRGQASLSRVWAVAVWSPMALLTPLRRAAGRARARRRGGDQLDLALDSLRDSDQTVLLVFSEDEPLYDEMVRDGHVARRERWPNLKLRLIPGLDHTMREIHSQHAAHTEIDRAIDEELARALGDTNAPIKSRGSANRAA
jgi:pimeloyl-ACP methyl ester carboxylesterase